MERSPYVAAELAAGCANPVMMLPEGYRHALLGDWCSVAVVDDLICGDFTSDLLQLLISGTFLRDGLFSNHRCKACFAAAAEGADGP